MDGSRFGVNTYQGSLDQIRFWIRTERPDGARVQKVPAPGAGSPAWSPGGRWLAYVSFGISRCRVFVQRPGGADRHVVHRFANEAVDEVSWSPDGQSLVLGTLDHVIYTVHTDGTDLTRISSHAFGASNPAWSPDGRWIAYQRRVGPREVRLGVMRPDGSARHTVLADGANAEPSWFPNGRWLVVTRTDVTHENGTHDTDLFVVRRDGQHMRRVTRTRFKSEHWGTFSPNGEKIVYVLALAPHVAAPTDLWTISSSGGHARLVSKTPALVERQPDWQAR